MRTLNLNKLIYKAQGFIKKQSPTILTVVGAVGVLTTSIFTAKGTIKAVEIVKELEEKKGEPLTKKEIVKVAAPSYIPAIVSGITSIACIFGSNTINKRRHAALMGAYTLLDQSYKEYKDKVIDLYGEETDKEIKNEIVKDKYEVLDVKKSDSNDTLLFFDEYANRWFWKTMEEVKDAEYHFNRNFTLRGYVELNEFYAFLGLDPTPYGATVGWSVYAGEASYGYSWVDFFHEKHESGDPDNPYYYTIFTPFSPHPDFMDY